MKQKDIAVMLHSKFAEVSHLFNGHFSRFSTDKLLGLLAVLEQKVTIQISPRKQGESFQEVAFA
jgi:predicted XRE-type DNA-binding protein